MPAKTIAFALSLSVLGWAGQSLGDEPAPAWKPALPGWRYEFPRDHAVHRGFKTEWWYFTGNLRAEDGHAYGYELTFFRQGIRPPSAPAGTASLPSRFVQNDFKFAHFAVSDLDGKRFIYTQKISRGAFGEAGFGEAVSPPESGQPATLPERLAWMENWSLQPLPDGSWHITARAADTNPPMAIDLTVSPAKPLAIEGTDGVSQKSAGLGNASHYYSLTRLSTRGGLALGASGAPQSVHGESWFDHEWASNQLASDQVGWNWFCFQFDDQSELMLYAMRRRDGSVDPASSGTMIKADGSTEHLGRAELDFHPAKTWRSPKTGATYPIGWQIGIPSRGINLSVQARLDDQELVLPPISYWEGAIQATGQKDGREIKGVGYMELTGYASPLKGLQQASEAEADLRSPGH